MGYWNVQNKISLKKTEILNLILEYPIHFREIGKKLGMGIGLVQHYTNSLEKNGEIKSIRYGRYRFFINPELKHNIGLIYALLTLDNPRKILESLSLREQLSHQNLSEILGTSPQNITYYCTRFIKMEIIKKEKGGRENIYSLKEENRKIIQEGLKRIVFLSKPV